VVGTVVGTVGGILLVVGSMRAGEANEEKTLLAGVMLLLFLLSE
jgi:hypothetical protein